MMSHDLESKQSSLLFISELPSPSGSPSHIEVLLYHRELVAQPAHHHHVLRPRVNILQRKVSTSIY